MAFGLWHRPRQVKRLLGLALPKLQPPGCLKDKNGCLRSSAAGKHILSAAAKKFGMKARLGAVRAGDSY